MSTAVVLAPSILVVDPRAASRLHASGLIRNRWPDARVNEADDGETALAEAAEMAADLVIVDLPGDTGLAYARRLTASQRYQDALQLVQGITASDPKMADAWLLQGALQIELTNPKGAETALLRYIDLRQSDKTPASPHGGASAPADAPTDASADNGADDEDDGQARMRGPGEQRRHGQRAVAVAAGRAQEHGHAG